MRRQELFDYLLSIWGAAGDLLQLLFKRAAQFGIAAQGNVFQDAKYARNSKAE